MLLQDTLPHKDSPHIPGHHCIHHCIGTKRTVLGSMEVVELHSMVKVAVLLIGMEQMVAVECEVARVDELVVLLGMAGLVVV